MSDVRIILERGVGGATPPPDAFERILRRRERKQRNKRIAAGVVGIAVFVAAIVAVGVAARDSGQQPASSGTTGPSLAPTGSTAPSGEPPLAGPEYELILDAGSPDYVLDLDTGAMTPLPGAIIRSGEYRPWNGRYAASPDASTLAFVAQDDDGRFQIFVANLDGTEIRQVTHDPVAAISPAWSPDATMIAYEGSSGELGVPALFVLDVVTGETTKVIDVSPGAWDAAPTFTPDGSSLLYSDLDSDVSVVRIVLVAGGESTILFGQRPGSVGEGPLYVGGMRYAGNASMSPDGSLVTMMGDTGGSGAFRVVANADGSGLRQIPGRESNPAGAWSPDGSRIVCATDDGEPGGGLKVVDIASGQGYRVAEGSAAIWLDDHTLLVEGQTHRG